MKAKGDWVVVCRRSIPDREKLVGHIILPYNGEDNFFEGVVVSAGEYCGLEGDSISEGDWVLVRNNSDKIEIGTSKAGKIYVVDYDDILCTIGENEMDDYE